jgi:hypothetical protein
LKLAGYGSPPASLARISSRILSCITRLSSVFCPFAELVKELGTVLPDTFIKVKALHDWVGLNIKYNFKAY